ncbi:ABC transporter substrate-binding protein [Priestia megaterium]|uniref:Multiple sugar ABC transporter, multiple sugar-binding protein MsmE n=1 Tax=Priestia megaterium (strain DSM 319 / IMG 1521) TaxID=592022 RepID=D5DHM2_PRIM3|nr:extracellular solute-binding protein [Priestia megaterium]ADF39582.1 multiple sugar ABC transporter, multiple sugar-binding protein MsmE [Priestia megaterium DSM 319]MED4216755.1 extracellular solute-binding protein [Priestia megaterium]WEZ38735.1 extracellular solute-binding protein [Priestia megaterium DSM 319]
MKKFTYLFVLLLVFSVVAAGCGNKEAATGGNGKTTLTLFSTMSNKGERKALQSAIAEFEKQNPDIKIDANFPGNGYEDMLRVKMGANDMPDLFDTHGWSQLRYGEYVADLKDMNWVQHLDPALNQILKDKSGKVYAYPLNQAKDGISYNATLLEKYGIKPPNTMDEFITALETVKKKSKGEVAPLWIPGGENGNIAQVFDQLATPQLITAKNNNYAKQLENGTFNWSNYTPLAETIAEMKKKGLLNKDVLTAKVSQATELMAQNKIAFTFVGGSLGPDATELNPEVKVGTVPVPAIHKGGTQSWIGGERFTLAAWKDSKHLKEAKKFIEFVSQPEVAKKIAEGTSSASALTNNKTQNYYSEYYDKYSDIKVEPYFDRKYLPSGMWAVMSATGQELLAGSLTPKQLSKEMEKEYKRLSKQ